KSITQASILQGSTAQGRSTMATRTLLRLAAAVALQIPLAPALLAQAPPPTFSQDVAPILQKNCQTCHRPGEGGPFALLTYADAKLMASSIKRVASQKTMPPWYADPKVGHFANDRSLSEQDIATLVAWANAGAPEGDKKVLSPPINWLEGWGIPKPDVVFQLPKPFNIPATGQIEDQYVIIPTVSTEDKWVQRREARPTNRPMVHHIIAYVREPGSNYFKNQKPGEFFVAPPAKENEKEDTSALPSDFLVGYAPGQPAEILQPGQAKLVKAGSDIVMEVH